MRVCFDVHGTDEAELLAAAHRILDAFSEGKRWNIDIVAHAEAMTTDATVQMWRGEVEAEHEDPE
jgi:hypothetical protein